MSALIREREREKSRPARRWSQENPLVQQTGSQYLLKNANQNIKFNWKEEGVLLASIVALRGTFLRSASSHRGALSPEEEMENTGICNNKIMVMNEGGRWRSCEVERERRDAQRN